MYIIQWIVFRGVGHAQVETYQEGVNHLVIAACGKTSWPGLLKFAPKPPPRVCEECAAVLGLAGPAVPKPEAPPAPKQGSLF